MIENLIEFYGDQLLTHGFFHADPHPGNILIRPDARIVLLDYGMVLEITPELRQDLVRVVVAAVRCNGGDPINMAYKPDMPEHDVSPSAVREATRAVIAVRLARPVARRA